LDVSNIAQQPKAIVKNSRYLSTKVAACFKKEKLAAKVKGMYLCNR
jgi:hypothetical protein